MRQQYFQFLMQNWLWTFWVFPTAGCPCPTITSMSIRSSISKSCFEFIFTSRKDDTIVQHLSCSFVAQKKQNKTNKQSRPNCFDHCLCISDIENEHYWKALEILCVGFISVSDSELSFSLSRETLLVHKLAVFRLSNTVILGVGSFAGWQLSLMLLFWFSWKKFCQFMYEECW